MLITLKTCNCGGFAVCPKFKNHFINKCALIYNIYLHTENMTFIYYILLHITVKKNIVQSEKNNWNKVVYAWQSPMLSTVISFPWHLQAPASHSEIISGAPPFRETHRWAESSEQSSGSMHSHLKPGDTFTHTVLHIHLCIWQTIYPKHSSINQSVNQSINQSIYLSFLLHF